MRAGGTPAWKARTTAWLISQVFETPRRSQRRAEVVTF